LPPAERAVRVLCRAKLNLVLEIVGRRPDGYHELATVMHPIALADELTIEPGAGGIELQTSGLPCPSGEANIAYRAAEAFCKAASIEPRVRIRLHKRIPAEAGLGGGSADAAGALRGLAALHGWQDEAGLTEIARGLGADVPFFLGEGAALAQGIGERLTPLPAGRFACVLALGTPGVNTRWAYSHVRPEHYTDGARAQGAATALRERGCVNEVWNGFEPALAEARPDLAELVAQMRGLVDGGAALTGSGACVFGLARDEAAARRAAATLERAGYWTWWSSSAEQPLGWEGLP
jgi:4-diphosphocytidyl-2-C-methyl-D-erythritol kinase